MDDQRVTTDPLLYTDPPIIPTDHITAQPMGLMDIAQLSFLVNWSTTVFMILFMIHPFLTSHDTDKDTFRNFDTDMLR